jgi:hypothetical protein
MALGLSVNLEMGLSFPEVSMRSELVFEAMAKVPNRYLLSILAAKAARAMHRPGARMEDSANDVLVHLSRHNPIACEQTQRVPSVVSLRPQMKLPLTQRKPKVVTHPLAGERSNAYWDASAIL